VKCWKQKWRVLPPLAAILITRSRATSTLRVAYHACWRTLESDKRQAPALMVQQHLKHRRGSKSNTAQSDVRLISRGSLSGTRASLFHIITTTNRWLLRCEIAQISDQDPLIVHFNLLSCLKERSRFMRSSCCLCVCVCPTFQRLDKLTYFNETWCEHCDTGGHSNLIPFNFLQI
jgi:hypothetical protein